MNASTSTPAPILELAQGRPVCTSLNVAKHFGKQHKNVLRDIERIKTDLDENFNQLNFEPVDYLDAKGELRPAYQLTRDGFTLLAFGFTGKRALAWKVKYIQAFNGMEAEIARLRAPRPCPPGWRNALPGWSWRRLAMPRRCSLRASASRRRRCLGRRRCRHATCWLHRHFPMMTASAAPWKRS